MKINANGAEISVTQTSHIEFLRCIGKIYMRSLSKEPNLLLEIDHILPVSKGGLTTEDNLQTLCWRCNRSKGAKIS